MNEHPIILTLDAGGTNFVFSAMQDGREITKGHRQPSHADNLDRCISEMIKGFRAIEKQLSSKPVACSFAFPGPADYENGILGNLPNFKAFNGAVPLKGILENELGIPVFINNDGDLFALGEAQSGILPWINSQGKKEYRNLIGITLGTGIGAGLVANNQLITGNNSCGGEIHNTLNYSKPCWNCEESVSTRAIQRVYAEVSQSDFDDTLMPGDIYQIAKGKKDGNQSAAKESFRQFGTALGAAICNTLTLIDGIVVLGGGILKGWDAFGHYTINECKRQYVDHQGSWHDRLSFQIFDGISKTIDPLFFDGKVSTLKIPGSKKSITYDALARTGIFKSHLGTSQAIMLGAYQFAINRLNS